MADDSNPFHKITAGQTFAYFEDMGMKNIVDKVEKVDDYTVRFTLKRPEAPFLADMAMDFASILSKEYFDTMMKKGTPNAADIYPIGTGPFEFVSYQKDATIRYKAFDAHFRGKPKVDTLVFSITRDATARYAKLKTGECHVMAFPKPADLAEMKADPTLNVLSKEGLNIGYIAFNTEKKPFDNKLVRQALNMAIDKESILKSVYQGQGQVAKNPIPPILWSYNNAVKDYPFDVAKAKEMLAKAGYPERLRSRPLVPAGDAAVQPRRQADGRADPGRLGEDRRQGEARHLRMGRVPQAQQDRRAGGDDVRLVGRQRRSRTTSSCRCWAARRSRAAATSRAGATRTSRTLIIKAAQTPKQADRAKLYEQAQVIFKEEAPWITVAHSVRFDPVRKEVKGYKMDATAHHYFNNAEVAAQEAQRRMSVIPGCALRMWSATRVRIRSPRATRSLRRGACALTVVADVRLRPAPRRADHSDVHRRDAARVRADPSHSRRSGREPVRRAGHGSRAARAPAARVRPRQVAAAPVRRVHRPGAVRATSARR